MIRRIMRNMWTDREYEETILTMAAEQGGEENDMENNDNIFLIIKGAIAAVAGMYSAAFGVVGCLALVWVACMAVDYVSGSAAACKNGEWSSAVAREGIFHKGGMLLVVVVAAITDAAVRLAVQSIPNIGIEYSAVILPVVLVWYIFTELGSIVENAAAMGANVPEKLVKLLAAGKAAVESESADTVVKAALTLGKSGKTLLEEMDYDELVELACQMGLTVKDGESRAELLSEIIKCAVEHESKQ